MRFTRAENSLAGLAAIACVSLTSIVFAEGPRSTDAAKAFGTPRQAADALVVAAETFDVRALRHLFGSTDADIVLSGEYAQDRQRATEFAAQAREKIRVSVDPKTGRRAFLLVGDEEWPFPIPIVKRGATWSFDPKAGRRELIYRRIGANELDAIAKWINDGAKFEREVKIAPPPAHWARWGRSAGARFAGPPRAEP